LEPRTERATRWDPAVEPADDVDAALVGLAESGEAGRVEPVVGVCDSLAAAVVGRGGFLGVVVFDAMLIFVSCDGNESKRSWEQQCQRSIVVSVVKIGGLIRRS
jgi:hypothetical protein